MAFFDTSKLPKHQLYPSRLSVTSKLNQLPVPATSIPVADFLPITSNVSLTRLKKNLSISSKLVSDEEFVHHINQIIDRKNFRLIERSSEMRTEVDFVCIQIDCNGYLPREIQVRAVNNNRLQVLGEHLEYFDQQLAIRKQIHRCYSLPADCEMEQIFCSFSKKGQLKIQIPRQPTKQVKVSKKAKAKLENKSKSDSNKLVNFFV